MAQNQRNLQIQVGIADRATQAFRAIASSASTTASRIRSAFSATIQGPTINTSNVNRQMSQLMARVRNGYRQMSSGLVTASGYAATGLTAIGAVGLQSFAEVTGGMTKLKASTGLTGKEFEDLGNIAKQVYTEGFGENFEAVSKTLGLVRNESGNLTKDLKGVTEQALAYSKAFDADPVDIIKAVSNATRNLGGDFQSNFNMIAQARQQVGDVAGDFTDTINEYSVQVGKAGLSTKDFLNIMIGSSKAGAFNFDKPIDAVKEFSLRLQNGDQSARDAFASIRKTLNQPTRNFEAEFASEDKEIRKKVMKDIIAGISQIKDKTKQAQVATQFFGTQFEDVGKGVIDALQGTTNYIDTTKKSAEELKNTFKFSDVQVGEGVVRGLRMIIEETIFTRENVAGFMKLIQDNKEGIKKGVEDIANAFVALAKFAGQLAPILTPIITKMAEFAGNHPNITAMVLGFALLAPQILAVIGVVSTLAPLLSGLLLGTAGFGAIAVILGGAAIAMAAIIINFEEVSKWIDNLVAGFAKLIGVYDTWKEVKSSMDQGLYDMISGSDFLMNLGQDTHVTPTKSRQKEQTQTPIVVNGPVITDNKNFHNALKKQLDKSSAQVNA